MKKLLLSIFAIAISIVVNAQTLTYSAFQNSVTTPINVKLADAASYNTSIGTTTGTGVTWNASGLTQQAGTPIVHLGYYDPSTTPYQNLYPSANYASYDPALTSVISYEYYGINADSVTNWGSYEPTAEHEIYQDPDKRLVFPFAFGQSFTDSYAKINYSNATTVSSNQTGGRTVTFNGFGTLTLPQGTFSGVALITEVRTNSLGPNSTSLNWWEIATGKRLMFYSENAGSTTVAWNTDIPAGLSETAAIQTGMVSPNPFSSTTTLILNGNISLKNTELRINDILGKQVRSIAVNANQVDINREGMENGIYFYQVISNQKVVSAGKLIVE